LAWEYASCIPAEHHSIKVASDACFDALDKHPKSKLPGICFGGIKRWIRRLLVKKRPWRVVM
jgi:hypothetical protein